MLNQPDRDFIDYKFGDYTLDLESPTWKEYKLYTSKEQMLRRLLAISELPGVLQDIITARRITLSLQSDELENASYLLMLIESEICRLDPEQCEDESPSIPGA